MLSRSHLLEGSVCNRALKLCLQWSPTSEVKCPICKGPLTEINDYKVGFECPRCGFKKVK